MNLHPKHILPPLIAIITLSAGTTHPDTVHITVHTDQPLQTIDGFGASDAWTFEHCDRWTTRQLRQTADLLFTTQVDTTGKPLGIGLTIWRFNIGTGSATQGKASQIGAPTHRTQSILRTDDTIDSTAQAPQRTFMKMAHRRGVQTFVAFANSPHINYTQNHLATNTGRDSTLNLRPECYRPYADHLANLITFLQNVDTIHINYLAPVNEPDGHWNWLGPKQEGTPALNKEITRLARTIDSAFTAQNITTRILLPESSDYRCMLGTYRTGPRRSNLLRAFFDPACTETYVGDLPHVAPIAAAHSYWTNTPLTALRHYRTRIQQATDSLNIGFWQTEVCIMQNDVELGGGNRFDPTMRTALYVARIIHHDLVFAHARSWQWWRAVGGNYKDGLLREHHNGKKITDITDSKLLWTLGNYSRFVRPQARRYNVTTDTPDNHTDPHGLMISAYRNEDATWAIVVLNYAPVPKTIHLPDVATIYQPYITTDAPADNLRPLTKVSADQTFEIPPRAAVTFVGR